MLLSEETPVSSLNLMTLRIALLSFSGGLCYTGENRKNETISTKRLTVKGLDTGY